MTEDELDWPPPESRFVDKDVALERIRDLTTTARTTWLVLIGFLAFIGLTLLSVRDVDFFSVSATTDLPIVNIAIPTTTFFWTASLLAAVLHTYFHVFLLKLWDALAEAPPEIDKLKLGDRVFPWLVNDWALRQREDRPTTRRPMALLGSFVTGLVIWLATPIVLAGFWWRSLPAHDAPMSLTIAAALWLSLFASMRGWRRARATLVEPGLLATRLRRRTFLQWCDATTRGIVTTLLWLAMLASVLPLAVATIAGTGAHRLPAIVEERLQAKVLEAWTQAAIFLWEREWLVADTIPIIRADLTDAEIAIEPDDWRDWETARRRFHVDWCRDSGVPVAACEKPASGETNVARADACRAKGIAFADCAAHFAGIDAAFEDEWRIERAAYIDNIRGPDLRDRDLRNAAASGAFLAGVDLREARLEGANLSWARLERADLSWAQFQSAEWASATFAASLAHSADFTAGKYLTQTQLAQVIGDADTVLPLDAETGEPLHVWSCWEEAAAARFIELWTAHREVAPEDLREWIISEGWICGPDNPRRPVGTPAAEPVPDRE